MKLVEYTRKFNLVPLLEELVEVSQHNFKFYPSHVPPTEKMVTIGLGRQTGQTTSIRELLLRNDYGDCIILTHSHVRAVDLSNSDSVIRLCVSQAHSHVRAVDLSNSVIHVMSISQAHKIFRTRSKPIAIIFDSCKHDQILKFFQEISPHFSGRYNFILNVAPIV